MTLRFVHAYTVPPTLPEERLPGGLVLARERLQAPQSSAPLTSVLVDVAADPSQHVEAAAGALAGGNAKPAAVDQQHLRPALGQLAGTHQLAEDVDPVGDQLPVTRGIAIAPLATTQRGLGQPIGRPPRGLGRRPVARATRDRDQRLANLARSEPILTRPRPTLPWLKRRRALLAKRVRLPLPRQHRRKTVRRPTVRQPTQPPLTTTRPLAIPARPHHHTTGMPRDPTQPNLHDPRP